MRMSVLVAAPTVVVLALTGCSVDGEAARDTTVTSASRSPQTSTSPVHPATEGECINVPQAYDHWRQKASDAGVEDWSYVVGVESLLVDGELFLDEVDWYTDRPALALKRAIAEYNRQLSLVAESLRTHGTANTSAAQTAQSGVRVAYESFRSQTCHFLPPY